MSLIILILYMVYMAVTGNLPTENAFIFLGMVYIGDNLNIISQKLHEKNMLFFGDKTGKLNDGNMK